MSRLRCHECSPKDHMFPVYAEVLPWRPKVGLDHDLRKFRCPFGHEFYAVPSRARQKEAAHEH